MFSRFSMRPRRWLPAPDRLTAAAAALIIAAVAASWAGSLGASFQFDDWHVIVSDERVRSLAAWWDSLPAIRPLLKLVYALGHALGAGPRGYRLFNLGVHGLNALLVFALIRRRAVEISGAGAGGSAPGSCAIADPRRNAFFIAFACAAIFALEPVQTEAVTYISGGSSSLVALPCLAALWCWDRAAADPARCALHGLGLLCYAAALAVKETAAVLPLALWLWHATTLPPPPRSAHRWNPLRWQQAERRAFAGYAAVAAIAAGVALASPTYRHLLSVSLAARSIPANIAMQAHAWGFLAAELVRLSALNADPTPSAFATSALDAVAWGAPWLALIAVAWVLRARAPALAFGVGWFVIWLLPTNSLLPRLDPANDRQLYLALIGPAWLVALGLARLHRLRPVYGWAVLGLIALVLGAATAERNRVYRTEISFWQDVLKRSPHDARAANDLGIAYAIACRDGDAARAFAQAIVLDPAGYRARINLMLLDERALTRRGPGGCRLAVP